MRSRPGLRVWKWERGVQVGLASTLCAAAAGVFGAAFLVHGAGRIISFVIAGLLVVLAAALFWLAANNEPTPPDGPVPVNQDGEAGKPAPGLVTDPSQSLSADLDSVGHTPITPPPGPSE